MLTTALLLLACTGAPPPAAPAASPAAPPAPAEPAAPTEPPAPAASGPERLLAKGDPVRLPGVCEASGAGWVHRGGSAELWVVDDEQGERVFRFGADLAPLPQLTLRGGTGVAVEIGDPEGLAPAGEGAWVIGSHSLSKSGKLGERARLARLGPAGEALTLTEALRPGLPLPDALVAAAAAACEGCAWPKEAATEASKKGGFDVEGLALDGQGRLLVGVRGPRVGPGRALVFAVSDPEGAAAIGPAWALDLGLRGVRDLVWDAAGGRALVLAGPSGADGPPPALYSWTPGAEPVLIETLAAKAGEAPEALALGPGEGELWIAWDAGERIGKEIRDFDCSKLAAAGFTAWAEARAYTLSAQR